MKKWTDESIFDGKTSPASCLLDDESEEEAVLEREVTGSSMPTREKVLADVKQYNPLPGAVMETASKLLLLGILRHQLTSFHLRLEEDTEGPVVVPDDDESTSERDESRSSQSFSSMIEDRVNSSLSLLIFHEEVKHSVAYNFRISFVVSDVE